MSQPSSDAPFAGPADRAACREAIKVGSRTFYAASLILPPSVREHAYGLYAFCRLSDDAIDLHGGSMDALERLRERLDRAYAGRPMDHAADRAMADLVKQFAVPRELPEALLEGLAWDAEGGRRYDTIEDLFDYAARVAASVGAIMTLLMGRRSPATLARACDLGVAMQLTNIARDVGEDARAGRLYLPLDWMREAGLDADAFVASPTISPALREVVARLLREADRLYARGATGVSALPASCRPAILAAGALYGEIGRQVARNDLDSVNQRARVSGRRKGMLLARSLVWSLAPPREDRSPALAAVDFMIRAVGPAPRVARRPAKGTFLGHVVGVLDAHERLERARQFVKP